MATMYIDYDEQTWDCSCGEEDQPWGVDSFWEFDEATCRACGVVFDLELEGDTESGFFLLPREETP